MTAQPVSYGAGAAPSTSTPNAAAGTSTSAATVKGGSAVILALGLELLAVGLLVVIADSGPDAGQATLLFTVGLWLVFLVAHPSGLSILTGALSKLQKGSS